MTKPTRAEAKKSHNMVLRLLGPGLVTGAADDDPSGIATYSQAGAQFGYGLLSTVFLTTPFMIAIQLVSARIGRIPDAVGFYAIIAAASVIGFGLGFTGIDAIHMLVWSAVLNGIVAVPIMAMMMVIVANSKLMGRFGARSWLVALGWLGTALMAGAVIALFGSLFAGQTG
jgi:Mn2+/Fe2+ NRAMP family transporter